MALAGEWRDRGILTPAQAERLEEIESGRLFSVHREIRALLYIGVAGVVAGVAMTVKRHFQDLGEAAIVTFLLAAIGASWGYCARRVPPYAREQVPSPTAAFDYLLYLGCALLGVLFGYLETQHHLLKDFWDFYLLASGVLFLALAYRCDNRFVLGLGLVNVGAWWGVRLSHWEVPGLDWRARAVVFGVCAIGAGLYTASLGLKRHFEETYLTAGVHPIFWALMPDAVQKGFAGVSLYAVLILAAAVMQFARRRRRFSFFAYGLGYGYVAASAAVVKALALGGGTPLAMYALLSGGAVIAVLIAARRQFEQDEA